MRRHRHEYNWSLGLGRSGLGVHLLVALAGVLAVLAVPIPIAAQTNDMSTCAARKGAGAVAACTGLINSGKAKGVALYLLYNDRGGAYQSIGADSDHHRAIDDFTKAIGLVPKLPYAFINRGVSWAALGAFDRSIEDFAQALRLDPKDARAFNNRGGAYRDRGEFDRALADFNKAIALDPKLADALFNRGTVYMQKEDYNRAIADYTAVLRQSPKDILALAARGRAWSGKDDLGRAMADYEAALAAPAEDPQSKAVKEAVRELLRALLERRAALEEEAALKKQATLEKAAQEKQAALDKKLAQEKRAALEKQAALEKSAREKQAALDTKLAQEKQAALEKQAAEKRAGEVALEKRVAAAKKASEEKQAALDKQAALQKSAPPLLRRPRQTRRERWLEIALVIGNSAYQPFLGKLENPANDATDVAKALTQLGFAVWLRLDLGHIEMKDTLTSFAGVARDAETAVVFFAGHGFQYGGANYLAPVDAPLTDDDSIAKHVRLDSVMAVLKAERGVRILIVDACRSNLAVEQVAGQQMPGTRSIVVKRGLSPVRLEGEWRAPAS